MTREETVELWRRCDEARAAELAKGRSDQDAHEAAKRVWNTWAEHLLSQRQDLEASRQFVVDRAPRWETEGRNDPSSDWLDRSAVIFCDITFGTEVSFQGFIFPGVTNFGHVDTRKAGDHLPASFSARVIFADAVFYESAWFVGTRFSGGAQFTGAEFHGDALFGGATFGSASWFSNATFSKQAWFSGAAFAGSLRFLNTTFRQAALFSGCDFKSYTAFDGARFLDEADFGAVQAPGRFDFDRVAFASQVPSFVQANFAQPPRLDNIEIPLPRLFTRTNPRHIASYRALRRIANQAQDFENEWRAFKGEMRASRGNVQKPWDAGFWVSLIYDALSDYGWSTMRPFLIWLSSIVAFAAAYLASAGRLAYLTDACSVTGTYAAPQWLNALLLSTKNAILFVGLDRNVDVQVACLYGAAIPAWSAFIFMAQNVFSALLIFLFLFAVRNQFKIK